jgi:uncharacterized membrane protein
VGLRRDVGQGDEFVKEGRGGLSETRAFERSPDSKGAAESGAAKMHAIESWISWTLRLGIGLSLVLLVTGTCLTFYHHPEYGANHGSLIELSRPGRPAAHTVKALIAGLDAGRGQAIVTLGLLTLIATPVLRVAISTVTFWQQRDWPFTFITLTVLGLLVLSMVLGKADL